jgi:hypothetical protein
VHTVKDDLVFNIKKLSNTLFYYIKLYFTVFLLARSNTCHIPFSNILISKKLFLCNKKSYCTLVQNQWMKLLGKIKKSKFKIKTNLKLQKFLKMFFFKLKKYIKFQNLQKFHQISKKFKMIKFSKSFKNFKVFIKIQN